MDGLYEELETPEGERKIFRIAKARDRATKDYTQIKQIKDGNGVVLSDQNKIKERWEGYFENLLNEENPGVVFEDGIQNQGVTPDVSRKEVKLALKKMKNGKATGPDGIPVEAWRSLGEEGIDMLWDLMQKIYDKEKIPEEWRGSVTVPIYKEKGDIQDCGNYRGIKLMSHTMKIWESWRGTVWFYAWEGNNRCSVCAKADDGETPGKAERTAHGIYRLREGLR